MIFGSFIFCSSYYFYGKFYKRNIIIENQQIDFIIIRYEKELKKKIYALYFLRTNFIKIKFFMAIFFKNMS